METIRASIAARAIALKAHKARLAIITGVILAAAALLMLGLANRAPEPAPVAVAPLVSYAPAKQPDPLTAHDRALYQSIYMAQDDGKFDEADAMIAQLDSKLLVGHVLAQRYLFTEYKTAPDELQAWLEHFPDHPQTDKIRTLASRKGAKVAAADKQEPALKGAGYIDHLGRSAMPQGWYHGLALWRDQEYDKAAVQFEKIAGIESLNEWHRAAAYYWAYRSYEMLADDAAEDMLALAAEFPTTFYGMIANAKLRQNGSWMAAAPFVPNTLRRDPSVLRAQALASIGREDEAEAELRASFNRMSRHERKAMVTLASEFNLPNLQVRLSRMKELSKEEALFASYPMPKAVAGAQDIVEPALIFAISRQESGFRPDVASHAGAVGMMQVMPSTANHIVRRLGTELASANLNTITLKDADTNVRLGAAYIDMLMKEPNVNGSLIHAIASYNAGPGAVGAWAKAARNVNDPLLYIESIPFKETRNYVAQVLAHYWVYQHLMGENAKTLQMLADGQWPNYKIG